MRSVGQSQKGLFTFGALHDKHLQERVMEFFEALISKQRIHMESKTLQGQLVTRMFS